MKRSASSLLLVFLISATAATAQAPNPGFAERFAMASNRSEVLRELIPGTQAHYFYSCLERQHAGDLAAVPPLIEKWIERHGRTQNVRTIEHRQALLAYSDAPGKTYHYLVDQLNLSFDHEPDAAREDRPLPATLDPAQVSYEAWLRRSLEASPNNLSKLGSRALSGLSAQNLSLRALRSLLGKLNRADLPNLPSLVVRELEDRRSRGFGALSVHTSLTLAQLDACARRLPSLLANSEFVKAYLTRLQPRAGLDWNKDPAALSAYLDRLEQHAERLPPSFNSLKAHVLFHRLAFERRQGRHDRKRFMRYLELPHTAAWVRPEFRDREIPREQRVVLQADHGTGLPLSQSDDDLVRDYLAHFFRTEDSIAPFARFVRQRTLERIFAETKIMSGMQDPERLASLLDDPAAFEALRDRVILEFPPHSPKHFGAADAVQLELEVKNVPELLVRAYRVNALAYYTERKREIDATLAIEGLMPQFERRLTYEESPFRSTRRRFEFPELARPGVYIVEFIGNGLSSRAVIHKGALRYTLRSGALGHRFRVLSEAGEPVPQARIRVSGQEFAPSEDGTILVPYSTAPGKRSVILFDEDRTSLQSFQHRGESFHLELDAYAPRESLIAGRSTEVALRTRLSLNHRHLNPSELQETRVIASARLGNGQTTSLEIKDPELSLHDAFEFPITIPEDTRRLRFEIKAKVTSRLTGQQIDLSSTSDALHLNHAHQETSATDCPYLERTEKGYTVVLLGRNGEPRPGRVVKLKLHHRDFSLPFDVALRTDALGRVHLGPLVGVERIEPQLGERWAWLSWALDAGRHSRPRTIQALAGSELRLPAPRSDFRLNPRDVSLIEYRGGKPAFDRFDRLAVEEGALIVRGLEPGAYALRLHDEDQYIDLVVEAGPRIDGQIIGRTRSIETQRRSFLRMDAPEWTAAGLKIQLHAASSAARVAVQGTHFWPGWRGEEQLAQPALKSPSTFPYGRVDSQYASGRRVADEFRYILDRRAAAKFPGNMLTRPGLLLTPWAEEDAHDVVRVGGGAGGAFGGRRGGTRNLRAAGGGGTGSARSTLDVFAVFDFMGNDAVTLVNLKPDENGVVTVPRETLAGCRVAEVIVWDREQTASALLPLEAAPLVHRDRRLQESLPQETPLSRTEEIEFLAAKEAASGQVDGESRAQVFDNLASIMRLYRARPEGAKLSSFDFLLGWPDLSAEEKRKQYSDHACHELHVFLKRRDPAFFAAVVRPFLQNKLDQSFVDRWLLDGDLRAFLEPAAFARLNLFEQILLLRKHPPAEGAAAKYVEHLLAIAPEDPALSSESFRGIFSMTAMDAKNKDFPDAAKAPAESNFAIGGGGGNVGGRPTLGFGAPSPSRSRKESRQGRRGGLVDKNAEEMEPEEEVSEAPVEPTSDRMIDSDEDELYEEGGVAIEQLKKLQRNYRALARTRRFVESRYWNRPLAQCDASLITINKFWLDYALHDGQSPFVPTSFPAADAHANEMLLALCLMDLPFEAAEHELEFADGRWSLTAAGPLLVVRRDLEQHPIQIDSSNPRVLVRQLILDQGKELGRMTAEVPAELVAGRAYRLVTQVTNPSNQRGRFRVLHQIPAGALTLDGSPATNSVDIQLEAAGTWMATTPFYFPVAGSFAAYPVQVAEKTNIVGQGPKRSLSVLEKPERVDESSWAWVSQSASEEKVLAYLKEANLHRTNLNRIAWRMSDPAFFKATTDLLRSRMHFPPLLWAYGFRHQDRRTAAEYLAQREDFVQAAGSWLDTPLLAIDAVERERYEHVEFNPLINSRAHAFAGQRQIENGNVATQYVKLLNILGYRPQLDAQDWMSLTYYLLLQDRIEDALATFKRVERSRLGADLQYDAMSAYLAFFTEDHAHARRLAERHQEHPVESWRNRFNEMLAHLDEAAGAKVTVLDPENRDQTLNAQANAEPSLEFRIERNTVQVQHRNLERCEVAIYEMDLEFLFSSRPFAGQEDSGSLYVEPNSKLSVALSSDSAETAVALPERYSSSNVVIEVRAKGVIRRRAHYANSLVVHVQERFGQLQVGRTQDGRPLSKTYVKVFRRSPDGRVHFHKDGYTDLRGRFDYATLSGHNPSEVDRYAILVASETHGGTVREVRPPLQ